MSTIQYITPTVWIKYKKEEIFQEITDAKANVLALKAIPFQRRWVEELQKIQLKMEISGTSQIEGADFAANELDVAIKAESAEQLRTRSQKQAKAAVDAYREIAKVPDDFPINADLIYGIHRAIVTNCDDDHCPPGVTSGVTSKPAIQGHFKSGQRKVPGTWMLYSAVRFSGKSNL